MTISSNIVADTNTGFVIRKFIDFISGRRFASAFTIIALLCIPMLAGCATRDPQLLEALKGVQVTEILVETTPDVATGAPNLNGNKPEEQVAILVKALNKAANEKLRGFPGGPTPARLILTLQTVNLVSVEGRILLEAKSTIRGTVRLENAKTGQLIAQDPSITGSDDANAHGYGLEGMAIAMVINAMVVKNQEALADRLAYSFVGNVKTWLTPQ